MLKIAYACLTLSILLSQANAASYSIDSSVSSSSSPIFKDLQDAVPYITNSGTISDNITVTLESNTVGIDQILPNFNIYGGIGGVDIIYANSPSMVSSSSDCSLLPSIVLSQNNSNSTLTISNIDYFSFTGVTLKIVADLSPSFFSTVGNITLKNVCMFTSDELSSGESSSGNYTPQLLNFVNINLLNITNLVIMHHSTGIINVYSSNLVIQMWQLIMYPSVYYNSIFLIYDYMWSTSTLITNLTITCDSWGQIYSPYIVWMYGTSSSNIANVEVLNCNFGSGQLFTFDTVNDVVVEQFNFSNLTFNLTENYGINLIENTNSFNSLINNIIYQNITGLAPPFDGQKNVGIFCIWEYWSSQGLLNNSLVQNILLMNSYLAGSGALIFLISYNETFPLQNVNFNNISIINTTFSVATALELNPVNYVSRMPINNVTFYILTNYQVINCTFNDSMMLSFYMTDSDLTVYVLDMWSFEVNNFTLIGNYFTSTGKYDPIEMLGTQFRLTNLYASNNTLSGCLFMTATLRMSTFTLVNSTINSLTLDNSSYFIGYTLCQSTYDVPEPAFYQDNQYLAETRPFSIINTTFSNVVLLKSSYLVYSCNPMIVVANNMFSNIYSSESSLIVFGVYVPPSPKPSGYSYVNSSTVEQKIFANYQPVLQTFTSMRDLISSDNPNNQVSIFFIGFQNNSFQNVTSNNEEAIISLSDMTIDTNSLGYFNTSFSNITINTTQDFNLFSFSNLNCLYFAALSCSNISGTGRIIGVSSTAINKLSFDSLSFNIMTETTAFQIISSICANISITNGVSKNILLHEPWIGITCETEESQISFIQNSFSNISVTAIPEELTPINFLLVQIQQAPSDETPAVFFNSNIFTNITLNKTDQGFAQDVYSSQMISLALSNSTVNFTQNTFENLINFPVDNILAVSALNISFVDCLFKNLTHYELSGGIYLVFNNLEVDSTIFQENTGKNSNGGGLVTLINPNLEGTSINVTFSNCTFARNFATTASLIQFGSKSLNLIFKDSTLMDNYAVSSGSIFLYQLQRSNISMSNIMFQFLYSYNDTSITYAYTVLQIQEAQSEVDIQVNNCNLQVNGPFYGDLISVNQSNNTALMMSNFTYTPSSNQSATTNLTFELNQNYVLEQGNPSFSVLNANRINASLNNISIEQINTNRKPLFIMECLNNQQNIYFGSLSINASTFLEMNNTESLISITSQNLQPTDICQIYISIANSSFGNITGRGINGAIIHSSTHQIGNSSSGSNNEAYDTQYTALSVTNSSFQGISAVNGSIYYSQRLFKNSAVLFQNSSFNSISASGNGGAFYIETVSQQQQASPTSARRLATTATSTTVDLSRAESYIFESNSFQSISALNGGIFYNPFPNGEDSTVILQNNTFSNIFVQQRGAILYLNNQTVNATFNQFVNAYAGVSGTIIYSLSAQYDPQQFTTSNILSPNITNSLQPLSFGPNYLDVQLFASFPIEIVYTNTSSNSYSNNNSNGSSTFLVTNISSYSMQQILIVTILKYQNGNISQKVIDTNDGISSVQFIFEGAYFGSKKVLGQYCSESVCYLNQSDLILAGLADSLITVTAFFSSINPSTNTNYNATAIFTIQLRSCLPGEINKTTSGTCEYCPAGTYSLFPADKSCSPCPVGGTCTGGSYIVLASGYWRNSTDSSLIVPCNDSGARCLGGYDTNCSDEYMGPVCSQCNTDNEYLPVGKASCSKCPKKSQVIVLAVFVYIAMLAYQLFVISTTLKDNTTLYKASLESSETPALRVGAYIVLLTTYSQISSVISKMQVGYISQLFSVSNAAGNPNEQASFSLQCIYYLESPDPFQTFKFKIIFFIFSPLAKLSLVLVGELIRAVIKRKEENKKKNALVKIGVATVVLIMLEQPGIIGAICEYLSCSTLYPTDDQTYITSMPNINCGTTEYNSFRNLVVIPALAVWGFVVPLIVFLILFKNRKTLEKSEMMRRMFGSLYSNYSQKAYYWGLVVMLFKICLFVLDATLMTSDSARETLFLLFIHGYYQFDKYTSPYVHKELIKVEKYMTSTFKWTLSLVLLKLGLSIPENSLSGDVVNLIIAAINILFVGYILLKIFAEYLKNLEKIVSKIKAWYLERSNPRKKLISLPKSHLKKLFELAENTSKHHKE